MLAGIFGVTAVLFALAGCRQTASLSKQEIVVQFTTDATAADHARVWALCQHIDNVDPEPLVTKSKYPATLLYNVRFRVDHASNLELQQLFDCLKQDPTVSGYNTGDSADN
ncbi:MAG TPA: hypothetical protein VII50_04405 [Acidothermaceae bacterium]